LTVHAPSATRDEDLPLHEDVRFLAAALGQVIRRGEGEVAFVQRPYSVSDGAFRQFGTTPGAARRGGRAFGGPAHA
jgi:hypothetical protein